MNAAGCLLMTAPLAASDDGPSTTRMAHSGTRLWSSGDVALEVADRRVATGDRVAPGLVMSRYLRPYGATRPANTGWAASPGPPPAAAPAQVLPVVAAPATLLWIASTHRLRACFG